MNRLCHVALWDVELDAHPVIGNLDCGEDIGQRRVKDRLICHAPASKLSGWRFHRDLYASRPEVGAVLHAHSPFAVSLACLRRDIPPFHYMIARFGGDTIRCADYAIFGSPELSTAAMRAMQDRKGCLLANHGMVVFGRDLSQALALAIEFETLCAQYWRSLQIGEPVLLSEAEMAEVLERFRWYGKPRA